MTLKWIGSARAIALIRGALHLPQKERLDVLLVERGLASSRERARALIMAGQVNVAAARVDKAGTMVSREAEITLRAPDVPFVSRGGLKLEKALDLFGLKVADRVCLDAGASTGGFTDCLLQRGATRVYAVDVGYGQIATTLREDPRVVVRERVNARNLTAEHVPEKVQFACVDVSFISLSKVLPAILARLDEGADLVALVKPQFEAGPRDVGKNGVVRKPEVHERVLIEAVQACVDAGLRVAGLTFSPVRGPKGNLEFLLWGRSGAEGNAAPELNTIQEVVADAHRALLEDR
ncbi:MAG: TlyA family RNA methyltransferase [Armatimonadetes bacterium]|nr:TlyA family RNA methyltransferase [Armatimonadota bacterium]